LSCAALLLRSCARRGAVGARAPHRESAVAGRARAPRAHAERGERARQQQAARGVGGRGLHGHQRARQREAGRARLDRLLAQLPRERPGDGRHVTAQARRGRALRAAAVSPRRQARLRARTARGRRAVCARRQPGGAI
jgi:hypothetical protein